MKNQNLIVAIFFALVAILSAGCNAVPKMNNGVVDDTVEPPPDTGPNDSCTSDADCTAGGDHVVGTCNKYGFCEYTADICSVVTCPAPFECDEVEGCILRPQTCDDGELNDQNACTTDVCDPVFGRVTHVVQNCDDDDPNTTDLCVDGSCQFTLNCGGGCDDGDPCTLDSCDPQHGCQHPPVDCGEGFTCENATCKPYCTKNSDCVDSNPCTVGTCDVDYGKCEYAQRGDTTCADADSTTTDVCIPDASQTMGFRCENLPTDCTGGCDDGNPCTVDICTTEGTCSSSAIPCGPGTVCQAGQCMLAPCSLDSDCDDGNPCTVNSCSGGLCELVHETICTGESEFCDGLTGNCVDTKACDSDCDDGILGTVDLCVEGVCQNLPKNCGTGTALNPETGECQMAKADPNCIDGTLQCQQYEQFGAGTLYVAYSICLEGNWFPQDGCGFKGGDKVCINGIGCTAVPQP